MFDMEIIYLKLVLLRMYLNYGTGCCRKCSMTIRKYDTASGFLSAFVLFFFLTNAIVVQWHDFKHNSSLITNEAVLASFDRPPVSVDLLKHTNVKSN